MSKIDIKTLWILRNDDDMPQIICAVDHFTDDGNPEWWAENSEMELRKLRGEYTVTAVIHLSVPLDRIMSILRPSGNIEAEVIGAEEDSNETE